MSSPATLVPDTHWDDVSADLVPVLPRTRRRLPAWLKAAAEPYEDFSLRQIYARYLPDLRGKTVLEIGVAPGAYLTQFAEAYGCHPAGVEYTHDGAAVTQRTFRQHGYDPSQVWDADVFSDAFLADHREQFDVVLSRGFIEHFTDLTPVIARHTALLKPGGILIVTIPNLRGFNWAVCELIHPESVTWHNLTIMDQQVFPSLFTRPDLTTRFCGYYGAVNWWFFYAANPAGAWGTALRLVQRTQPLLNLVAQVGLRGRALGKLGSAGLVYIGQKAPTEY